MSRPAWLPPLNSHENYSINVVIRQFHDCPTISSPGQSMNLELIVHVNFHSDDISKHDIFDGLALWKEFEFPSMDSQVSDVELRKSVQEIIGDRQMVPFTLDRIQHYREIDELEPEPLDQSYDNQLHGYQDLVFRITDFLIWTMAQFSQTSGGEKLAVALIIEKSVTVPDQELEAWKSWYEEQKRLDPNGFEGSYWRAISLPRTLNELWYESSLLGYESAAESCIASLEKSTMEEELGDSCSICMEEYRKGEQVTKLSCSHVFHGQCLIQWLKTSRFCPLCRLMLPKSS